MVFVVVVVVNNVVLFDFFYIIMFVESPYTKAPSFCFDLFCSALCEESGEERLLS